MRYYIADCHFFHENLNTQMDRRGFPDAAAMNDYMIRQWNRKVRDKDEVVILGDFSLGTAEQTNQLLEELNGRKYLILGNHDGVVKRRKFRAELFEWIRPYEELHDQKRKVILSHYPILCYNSQYRLDRDGAPSAYMLYGHVHDTFDQRLIEHCGAYIRSQSRTVRSGEERPVPFQLINCFCMYSDYTPLTLDEWIEKSALPHPWPAPTSRTPETSA